MSQDRMKRPAQADQGNAWSPRARGVAPGKVTLTSKLSSGQGPRPVQRKSANTGARQAAAGGPVEDWTLAAVRPDLYQAPVQCKSRHEVDLAEVSGAARPTGGGSSMPAAVQAKMERSFGTDFSAVRIHQGPQAASMGALAYTQGTDIHFAPGSYDPQSQRGQELLGHELAHVVQQGAGRVRAPAQAKGMPINADATLEREADEQGARAARGELVSARAAQTATGAPGAGAAPIQAKWLPSPFSEMFYEWDEVLQGLRWYVHKEDDAIYFVVEQMTDENRAAVPYEKQIKTYQEWQQLGFVPLEGVDNSVGEEGRHVEMDLAPEFGDKDWAPFVFKPVGHNPNKNDSSTMDVNTTYRRRMNDKAFAKAVGAAEAHKNPKTGLKLEKNIGRYVFHLTTYRNLLNAPDDSGPGIRFLGLQPRHGGGPGGACETSEVTGDQEMIEGSKLNSTGVVAVNTAPRNIKLYANQRLEYNAKQFGEGLYAETDLVERDSILLRFRLTEEHIEAMEVDPQHPNDPHVRLIRNIVIAPEELQALISGGWVPLTEIDPEVLSEMMPNVPLDL